MKYLLLVLNYIVNAGYLTYRYIYLVSDIYTLFLTLVAEEITV